MRLAYDYVDLPAQAEAATSMPASEREFGESLGYAELRFSSREEFLAYARQPWIEDLRVVLREFLEPGRSVLSVGSGKGEHEVPLFLDGYDITASDIVEEALEDAQRLFPGFEAIRFDVLRPDTDRRWDDVLATGIDYALDDAQLGAFLRAARELLNPGGRVIWVHRYNDNLGTRAIDRVLLPAWARFRGARYRRRGEPVRVVKREHGYRRRRRELQTLAESSGYRVGRVAHACFGLELERVPIPRGLLRLFRRADRRLHVFNSATVFELEMTE